MSESQSQIDRKCVNTLRFLACDAIEKARSGHPGLPLGAAPMAYVLWTRHLRHHPSAHDWADRDRFVLSAGHGSSLLYSLFVLSGYDLTLDELQTFRQWGSRAAGHPESQICPGVEITTGPLGQGIANAVGMAIAERHLAACYNTETHSIVDHRTYALVGDGCLMEGVSYEAAALAGHLRLGKLIVLYDSNRISLAGTTSISSSEDTAARSAAAGWQVLSQNGDDEANPDRDLDGHRSWRSDQAGFVQSTRFTARHRRTQRSKGSGRVAYRAALRRSRSGPRSFCIVLQARRG